MSEQKPEHEMEEVVSSPVIEEVANYEFDEVVATRAPPIIVKLAPTSEDGKSGEAVFVFKRLRNPREVKGKTKEGVEFSTMRYEIEILPISGSYVDAIKKEEVSKMDPKTKKVIGVDLIPYVYGSVEELREEMKKRDHDYVVLRLSRTNYEMFRQAVEQGKLMEGDIVKVEFVMGQNNTPMIRTIKKARIK
jgi:hypothetical protein